jgi:AraC-like DNA-binding protein
MARRLLQRQFFGFCGRRCTSGRLPPAIIEFVHVAARLPPASMARLRAALGTDDQLTEVTDWSELQHALRSHAVDLIVVDPRRSERDEDVPEEHEPSLLLTLLTEYRSVPAILYSTHTREGLRAVLPLARSGAYQVIFRGFDDTRDRLRALLDQVAADLFGERMLDALLPRLEKANAPAEVVQAIARLFRSPQAFRTVHQLATVAGRRRGQLDRWMLKAGLAPAKVLIIAARVAWTHHYLRAPGNRFKTVALRLGYHDTAALGRHVKWLTGMTPTRLRRGVTADELLSILLRRVVRP